MELPLHLPQSDMLKLEHVDMIREGRVILSDVNLQVKEGDFVAIKIGRASCRERVCEYV